MKSKKVISSILCLLLIGMLFAGCGKSASAPAEEKDSSKKENVTITYGIWDKNQEPTLREIADAFEAKNPNIKVKIEVTPWTEYWAKLENGATGGALPDVFWMNGPNVTKYAMADILLPIDDKISKDSVDLSVYPESLIKLYSVEGKKYAIPKGLDTIGLWYNKAMFDEAKIAYPDETWDWNKLVEVARKMTNKSKGIYGFPALYDGQMGYYNTIAQCGGFVISDDRKKSGYDLPETVEGIKVWIDLIKEKISPTFEQMADTDSITLFESGKTPMLYAGSYMTPEFINNEYLKDKVDVAVLPKIKKSATIIHGLGNVIYAQTKTPDEAWEFVKFLGGPEANEMQAKAAIDIPAYQPAQHFYTDSFKNYNLKAFTDQIKDSVMYPASKDTGKWMEAEDKYLKQIWSLQMSPEEGCKKIAEEMNAILEKEQEK